MTSFLSSTHVLYDIIPDIAINGGLHYNLGACAVFCTSIYFKKFHCSALYINNNYNLVGLSPPHLSRISRVQYGPEIFPYGAIGPDSILEYVFRCTSKSINYVPLKSFSLLKSTLSGNNVLDKMKISAKHIQHIRVKDFGALNEEMVLERLGNTKVLFENLLKVDMHESFFCGLLLWVLLLPDRERNLFSKSMFVHIKYGSAMDFFTTIKKELTLKLKALQNTVNLDLSCFFEMEVLVNRGLGDIDWKQERLNRTILNVAKFDNQSILQHTRELFTRLKKLGGRPKRYSWDNFWKLRWQWSPTGSYTSQYDEDKQYSHADYDMRHKFYGFCAMGKVTYEHFSKRKSEMYAKASIKYEWGKQRAIYGVDNTNFIMSSYGMAGAEEVLSKLFPIGVEAESEKVKRKVGLVLENGIPYCFDFEDFNSQHDTYTMQLVLKAYIDVYSDYLEPEQIDSVQWLIRSLENMYVVQPDGTKYRASGTLLSGWRLTTFMNTVLNYVYTMIMMGESRFATTHNGDDILGAITNLNEIRNLEEKAVKHNVRFQTSKCYLGAIAEFLRVDHYKGNGSQYLARAISTYVHGPTEMAIPNDPIAVINAILTRASEIKLRKGDTKILASMTQRQLENMCRIWELDRRIVTDFEKTHRVFGGYSREITNDALTLRFHRTRIKSDDHNDGQKQSRELVLPGVYDYALYIAHKYGLENHFKKILNTANMAVYSRSVKYRFGVHVSEQKADHLDRLHAVQYAMFSKMFSGVKATIAKSFGVPIESVRSEGNYLTQLLSWCQNPLDALALWS